MIGTDIKFEQTEFILQKPIWKNQIMKLKGFLSMQNVSFFNRKYSESTNEIEYFAASYLLKKVKNFISLDSSSTLFRLMTLQ